MKEFEKSDMLGFADVHKKFKDSNQTQKNEVDASYSYN
jgi:hypothetical protein